ncbi:MAG: hypothetical protein N3A38_11495, partial [Planctomycetota bacterium]|nr:hypothetical protein [Planctomycetota bacterium]
MFFERRPLPGGPGQTIGIYMKEPLNQGTPDTVEYFVGRDRPEGGGYLLKEPPDAPASARFEGEVEGSRVAARFAEFGGLTDGVDRVVVEWVWAFPSGAASRQRLAMVETASKSNTFVAEVDVSDGGINAVSCVSIPRSIAKGAKCFAVRLAGLPGALEDYRVGILGVEFELNAKPEGIFVKGPSNQTFYVFWNPNTGYIEIIWHDGTTLHRKELSGDSYRQSPSENIQRTKLEIFLGTKEGETIRREVLKKASYVLPLKLKAKRQPESLLVVGAHNHECRVVPNGQLVRLEEFSTKCGFDRNVFGVWLEQAGEGRVDVIGRDAGGKELSLIHI